MSNVFTLTSTYSNLLCMTFDHKYKYRVKQTVFEFLLLKSVINVVNIFIMEDFDIISKLLHDNSWVIRHAASFYKIWANRNTHKCQIFNI